MKVTKPGIEEKIILTTLLTKNIGIGKFVVKPLPWNDVHVNNQDLKFCSR